MIKQPAYLKKGDKVAIVCPAKKLPKSIDAAIAILEGWGLEVVIGETVTASYNQFAGDDALRTSDLQQFLDNPDIKAVIAGRGGYGTLRIIDELDFTKFVENPKWIVGFSDITVLLSHVYAKHEVQCIHGQMPYTFEDSTTEALASLKTALFGGELIYESSNTGNPQNRAGEAEGVLIGGNLTLLVMLQGSESEINYTDKILFIEDVGEHEYSVDRLVRMLKRNGKFGQLKGLIVGAFNGFEVEDIPFGETPEQVIWELVKEYDYPVCFNFQVGHIDDNRAMVVGKKCILRINDLVTQLEF
ncbi:MAG: LD-carboxypeptidase [Pedobacter sp.]|nr:MAG: LD-carboxypeptidase [Pedobacter sp.]